MLSKKETFQLNGSDLVERINDDKGSLLNDDFDIVRFDLIEMITDYNDNDSFNSLCLNLTNSIQIARDTVLKITKKAAQVIQDKYIDTLIPDIALDWISNMQSEILFMDEFKNDQNLISFIENDDKEPSSQMMEHWRRFIVGVGIKKEDVPLVITQDDFSEKLSISKHSQKSHKYSLTSVLISQIGTKNLKKRANEMAQQDNEISNTMRSGKDGLDTSQKTKKEFSESGLEFNFVNMGTPIEENVLENGMRLAYERDLQLKLIQEQVEKQRQLEIKEQQKQLRQIGASYTGKKQFTFDFEGRIIIQSEIKQEKLAPTQYKLGYDINLVEQKQQYDYAIDKQDKVPAKKDKIEAKLDKELQKLVPVSNNISQMDIFMPNKGVTIFEGNQKKQGPSHVNDNYKLMNENEISMQLSNPQLGLKLSKGEYQSIVGKGYQFSRDNGKNKEKDIEKEGQFSILSKQQESINISNRGGQNQSSLTDHKLGGFNSSLNSSLMNLKRGSIRILNENSVDNLIVNDSEYTTYRSQEKSSKFPMIQVKKKSESNPNEEFNQNILNMKDWGSNIVLDIKGPQRKPKLPSVQSIHYSLPLLPKNPRERLTSQAIDSSVQSKRLPPPNVGKVIGHRYKGFKL